MNATQKYNEIVEQKLQSEEQLKKANEELSSFPLARIDYLHQVGSSVMDKCFGTHYGAWRKIENIRDYLKDTDLEWFRYWNDPQKEIDEVTTEYISFRSPRFSTNLNARSLKVPRKFIHMSDRDFAKMIRKSVRVHKIYRKLNSARNAEKEIQALNKSIEETKQQIHRLQQNSSQIDALREQWSAASQR